jgi:hypothetical protein
MTLHDTDFATAICGTIHLKLLKIGAIVGFSVRRIKIAMASACPAARDWLRAAIRVRLQTPQMAARTKLRIVPLSNPLHHGAAV